MSFDCNVILQIWIKNVMDRSDFASISHPAPKQQHLSILQSLLWLSDFSTFKMSHSHDLFRIFWCPFLGLGTSHESNPVCLHIRYQDTTSDAFEDSIPAQQPQIEQRVCKSSWGVSCLMRCRNGWHMSPDISLNNVLSHWSSPQLSKPIAEDYRWGKHLSGICELVWAYEKAILIRETSSDFPQPQKHQQREQKWYIKLHPRKKKHLKAPRVAERMDYHMVWHSLSL